LAVLRRCTFAAGLPARRYGGVVAVNVASKFAARDAARLSGADSKDGRLQRACLELLREHYRKGDIPTNGRFLFYELEQRGVIPKKYDGINPKTGKPYARTPLQDV